MQFPGQHSAATQLIIIYIFWNVLKNATDSVAGQVASVTVDAGINHALRFIRRFFLFENNCEVDDGRYVEHNCLLTRQSGSSGRMNPRELRRMRASNSFYSLRIERSKKSVKLVLPACVNVGLFLNYPSFLVSRRPREMTVMSLKRS